jgi:hypothetical protein
MKGIFGSSMISGSGSDGMQMKGKKRKMKDQPKVKIRKGGKLPGGVRLGPQK